jgi:hypothetical protein
VRGDDSPFPRGFNPSFTDKMNLALRRAAYIRRRDVAAAPQQMRAAHNVKAGKSQYLAFLSRQRDVY